MSRTGLFHERSVRVRRRKRESGGTKTRKRLDDEKLAVAEKERGGRVKIIAVLPGGTQSVAKSPEAAGKTQTGIPPSPVLGQSATSVRLPLFWGRNLGGEVRVHALTGWLRHTWDRWGGNEAGSKEKRGDAVCLPGEVGVNGEGSLEHQVTHGPSFGKELWKKDRFSKWVDREGGKRVGTIMGGRNRAVRTPKRDRSPLPGDLPLCMGAHFAGLGEVTTEWGEGNEVMVVQMGGEGPSKGDLAGVEI